MSQFPLVLEAGQIFRTDLSTRMPFRYGITTVRELPHVFVRVPVVVGGQRYVGLAADHLAPKWFTKNPDSAIRDDIDEMLRVIRQALVFADGLGGETPFDVWRSLYETQAAWGKENDLAPLLTNFGVSLVERALVDAFCQAEHKPFAQVVRENTLGIRLGDVHEELGNRSPADFLPPVPLSRVRARHTVGLLDPLHDHDIAPGDRVTDGLSQSLEACVRAYGLTHFKLKVGGDIQNDAARLGDIVSVLAQTASGPKSDWAFSIDGNESYQTLADFRAFWDVLQITPGVAPHLADRLLFVEQPLHRRIALSEEAGHAFASWPDRPPIIIDESDAELGSLPTALAHGYAGTSHKNCKGVFKGIINASLLSHRQAANPDARFILSGEDLSNVGPVALLQDLAVQAALGIESVERNGHHYFAGLSQFPPEIQDETLSAHGDVFHAAPAGWPTLTIAGGFVELGTVNAQGLGVGFVPDVTGFADETAGK